MEFKHIQKSSIKHINRSLRKWGIPIILVAAFSVTLSGEAKAASSWNPTLLVNTESFNVIDDGDGTTDIEMRFGETVDEKIRWMINENRFEFSRDLRVAGTITATGSIAASGSLATDTNLTINADNGGADAVITFGNDAGSETITFSDSTNQFEVSDDLKTTGNFESDGDGTFQGALEINDDNNGNATLTFGNDAGDETIIFNDGTEEFDISDDVNVTGTLDTTGNITTDANLTINENNSDADAVLTFGNDAGAKALTYSNANTRFEFNDDVHITGTLETTSNLTVGGTVTLNGVTYTFPASDGAASGRVLKTDGAGNLTWATDIDTNTDTTLSQEQVEDYVGGMVDANTETLISVTYDDNDGTLDFVVDEASIDHDALTNFVANEHISWVAGDGASANLETTGSISGATIHAQDSLTSSGTFSVDGTSDLRGAVTIGNAFTLPTTDGTAGYVLKTDGNGVLTWQVDNAAADGLDQGSADDRYVNTSGDTMTGDLVLQNSTLTATGLVITENATVSGALSVEGNISTDGNLSGSTLTVDGDVTLHGVTYSAPTSDGARGQVLTTDGAGNLVWSGSNLGVGSGGVVDLSPEYPNAVYFNSGSVTNYIGQMTYDYDETNNENYYRWTSSKGDLQEYWISARVRIPDNFRSWDDVRPIQFRYRTGDASAANNFITMRLYDTAGNEVALTGGNDLANTSWTTATISGPESSGTFTAGSNITVAVKLVANSSGSADAGYINLNFETTAP